MRNLCKRTIGIAMAVVLMGSVIVPASDAELKAKTTIKTKNISVIKGKTKTIKLKNKSSKCRYSFTSNKKKIAKVSAKGVVKGVSKGKAKITVKQTIKKTKKTVKLGVVNVTVSEEKKAADVTKAPDLVQNTPTPSPSPVSTPTLTPEITPCLNIDFSDGNISMFQPEGNGVKLELSTDGYYDNACLKASNRTDRGWFGAGMALKLAQYVKPGKVYSISCYVKCEKDATITLRNRNSSGFTFPSQIGTTLEVKANNWTEYNSVFASPDKVDPGYIIYWDASATANLYLDSIVIKEVAGMDSTFKDTFSEIFGNIGTCNNYTQMRDNKLFTTSLYNSVTMENEMKPDYIITDQKISSNVPAGYVVPDGYQDKVYPEFNFSGIDSVIKTAYEYGLKVRFHVLVWHTQTPSFFFKVNYNDDLKYVSSSVMDGRLDYYITNVMKHIYETEHGADVVYAWDVVNEYFHNYDKGSKSPWNIIYYPNEKSQSDRTNKPSYVKTAFTIAHRNLEYYGLQDKVSLFYNDYNTYEVTDDIIEMINYVNEDGKVCDGVGMQSHLAIDYPTPLKVSETIDAFAKQGFEIQITELDVKQKGDPAKQSDYYCNLIKMLVLKKKAGVNITGLTFWGLCDSNSWIWDEKPLLFSSLFCPKDAFYKVIETAQSAWK